MHSQSRVAETSTVGKSNTDWPAAVGSRRLLLVDPEARASCASRVHMYSEQAGLTNGAGTHARLTALTPSARGVDLGGSAPPSGCPVAMSRGEDATVFGAQSCPEIAVDV